VVAQNIAFAAIALVMAVAAVRVVTTDNVVHAALWLVAVLGGAAAQYVLLAAEFVAAVQVLVYVGAIVVLFLFGTMLTRARIGRTDELTNNQWGVGLIVGLVLAGVLGYVLLDHFGDDKLPDEVSIFRTADVSDAVFGQYLLPFEIVSVVLLAALIGAIVLARRD
jgi:NADH-quinone oxidoreductase subunit J